MGFLKNQLMKQLEAAKANVSEERIEELEAQGYDMTEYREALNAKKAEQEQKINTLKENYKNPTDLKKLEPYVKTPRSTETEFFKAVAGKAPFFGKSKWRAKYSEAPIIYMAVLDGPDEALAPPTNGDGSYYFITIYAMDEAHARNEEWLQRVVTALKEMRDRKRDTPEDCREVVDMMRNKDDESDWRSGWLGQSIAEGAKAYYRRSVIEQKYLPQGFLPDNGILPVVCTYIPEKESHCPISSNIPPAFFI